MKITVQKKVPMPPIIRRGMNGTGRPKYPWAAMEIGDSFAFPTNIGRQSYAAAIQASKGGKKFRVARYEQHYRCWRVA